MARRLLTTLHVSQIIDPFLSARCGLAVRARDCRQTRRACPPVPPPSRCPPCAAPPKRHLRRELDAGMTGVIVRGRRARFAPARGGLPCAARDHRHAAARYAGARAGARRLQQQRLLEPQCAGGNPSRDRRAGVAARRGRGEIIAAGDVLVQSRVLPGLTSPYVSRIADLTGRLTRRPIPEGTAVTADALDAPLLIHRGQNVILAARAGGAGSPGAGNRPGRRGRRTAGPGPQSQFIKDCRGSGRHRGCGAGEPVTEACDLRHPKWSESANFSSNGLKFRK